jgi:hypothetical protein
LISLEQVFECVACSCWERSLCVAPRYIQYRSHAASKKNAVLQLSQDVQFIGGGVWNIPASEIFAVRGRGRQGCLAGHVAIFDCGGVQSRPKQ